ncbi:MAG TPA: copper chaperone PCu(A)C [Pseudolabrys sp.]|nr:copper chaperone PCu(A)C [Pseudolabrys sp.]
MQADNITVGGLKISAHWVRATPKGAPVGGGYMTITNTGSASDRLVGGSADVSSRFEIHQMSLDNGVMKMRPVDKGLEIKPGQTVELSPGGYHVMFVGLNKPFEEGQYVKATLGIRKSRQGRHRLHRQRRRRADRQCSVGRDAYAARPLNLATP